MSDALTIRRRQFAEEIGRAAQLPGALIEAFATVPRERYLDVGPWLVVGYGERQPRRTPDGDPMHLYQNCSVAIDPARQLFNGAPSFLGMAIAALDLRPGARVLHIGAGLGYYTAVMASVVGTAGRVLALEVDPALAARARGLVEADAPIDLRHGDGTAPLDERYDAILINAGVTHPLPAWLDALAAGGHLVLPLTVSLPGMGPIGKGILARISRAAGDDDFNARVLSIVAIYSAVGLRDETLVAPLGAALMRSPTPSFTRLTRRPHAMAEACWLHTPAWCLTG
jgi:protein-L-isoaspartate(D-aspartate) O-methyltransferase